MSPKLSKLGERQRPSEISRLMTTAVLRPDMMSLAAGFTDTGSLPLIDVCAIVDSFASKELGLEKSVLQYGANQGRGLLRSLLTRRIEKLDSVEENTFDEERVLITNGSQQQLYLAVQTLCNPGDIILVEQPTYFVFLEMLEGLGVEARSMPMAQDGNVSLPDLENLLASMEEAGESDRLKAVYLVSYYANPSGHTVSMAAKKGIASMLSERAPDVALIEDAAYRELQFGESRDIPGILSIDEAQSLPLLYTSTLTKPFASGLKVGFGYCSDQSWLNAMLSVKGQQDFGTAHFSQAIMERALENGAYDRHLLELRQLYRSKMLCMDEALGSGLKELGWSWGQPEGGLYFWSQAPDGLCTDFDSQFHQACSDEGVMYVPGDLCHAEREPRDFVRLSYGVLDEDQLVEASQRFLRAARSVASAASK